MARSALFYIVLAVVALSFAPRAYAFGAGNIPSYSYLEDKAFRHGDIEDIIATLCKTAGGGFLSRGKKFNPMDVKRVYFGNWLRDYSQAVDIAALKKTNLQTILNLVMVLGFMAHGYATEEFEVTTERLGCYLPVEHIDNPKGYGEGEDPRKYDSRLRPPIDPRELEIDPQTGMKNYIANENGNWETSKTLVRRTLKRSIEHGRKYKHTGAKEDQYEAFRLLGQALHTLEDFSAHSNFCELALISMGHQNVFPHVGRNCKVRSPRGKDVYPLVTGSFGGADFIHSLMGEATDHLSQASVSDLTKSFNNSRSIQEGQSSSTASLRKIFLDLPDGNGHELSRDMDNIANIRATTQDPANMSPQELHKVLWQVLSFRDRVMKRIEMTIDKIPGLSSLVEKVTESITVFVITTIEPFVKPMLGQATTALSSGSQAVIDSHDQYEVWTNWNADDPTHSFLSKDHFGLILNEPAGSIARLIVEFAVQRVVTCWDDASVTTDGPIDEILQCMFHPDFTNGSQIQVMMLDHMKSWLNAQGGNKNEILNRLTSDSVKAGKNKRIGDKSNQESHHQGLQGMLQQQNVHVPGAGVLNAGQDLLGGKMPWDPNFGKGGAHPWRDMDPADQQAAAAAAARQPSYNQSQGSGWDAPAQPQQQRWDAPSHPPPGQQQRWDAPSHPPPGHQQPGGWNQPQQQQGGWDQPPGQQQQQGRWNPPSHPPPGHQQQGGWNNNQQGGGGYGNQGHQGW